MSSYDSFFRELMYMLVVTMEECLSCLLIVIRGIPSRARIVAWRWRNIWIAPWGLTFDIADLNLPVTQVGSKRFPLLVQKHTHY